MNKELIINGKKNRTYSPGEMLREEFLTPLNMKPEDLAQKNKVPAKTIKDICQEKISLTPEIICRLAIYFKMPHEFWLGIQQDYERECLEDILENHATKIKRQIQPLITSVRKVNGRVRKSIEPS